MRCVSTLFVLMVVSFGCSKTPKSTSTEAPVDNRNTNYQPGAGVAVNTIKAGKRTAVMHDFDQLKILIFAHDSENSRMPTKEELRTSLKADAPNLLKMIDDGAIIVPATLQRDGLWAYEVDADKAGGIVIFANGVMRKTADEMKTLLAQK